MSGVGKHVPGNPAGCATKQSLEGVEATLETARGGPPFEASLDSRLGSYESREVHA